MTLKAAALLAAMRDLGYDDDADDWTASLADGDADERDLQLEVNAMASHDAQSHASGWITEAECAAHAVASLNAERAS